jgi:signal recognition particle receptor subunit beta
MAQWCREERTLHAKIVYYGPAIGGKTSNLEALQRMTDARGAGRLLSTQTTDDRTLFFDLLTIDLPDLFGYKIAIKLFTVPGQVRYDTARQVVLSGADAIVFVADSCVGREEQNRWSIQNLQMNMRAKRLDPAQVPVLYQFNKQDMPDAAEPEDVATWVRAPDGKGTAAVATEGRGVLETFEAACGEMLKCLVAQADENILQGIATDDIDEQLRRALEPYAARREWSLRSDECSPEASPCMREPIAAKGADLLQDSIRIGVRLGELYTSEIAKCWRAAREADAYRTLTAFDFGSGAAFDREAIADAHLGAVADALDAGAISLVHQSESGQAALDRVWGRADDPLLASAWGRRMIRKMCATSKPITIEDLHRACDEAEAKRHFQRLRSMAAVPVGARGTRLLLAYSALPDGRFNRRDLRFLTAAAVHLGAALHRAGLHEDLQGERDLLKEVADSHSAALMSARERVGELERAHAELLRGIPRRTNDMLEKALEAAGELRDKRIQGNRRADALALIIGTIERMQEQQEQVIGNGARLREGLDRLIRMMQPEQEREIERKSQNEVLNVG